MLSSVKDSLRHHLAPGEPVLAGVSGGADSVALLNLLVTLGWRPHVCHLNHGWRGDESDADAGLVTDLATRLDLPVTVERATAMDQTEVAARQARYAFFGKVARRAGIGKLALGHTADDQVETFLLRLIRGAGVPGLVGIWPDRKIEGLRVIRPMLDVTHQEVLEYLRANNLPWRDDASNLNPRFLRNRVRHELIPLLERNYNPGIRDVLQRTAEILRDEDFYLLHHIAERYYLRSCREDRVVLPVFRRYPTAVQRRLLRFWLGGESESEGARYDFDHIEAVRRLAIGKDPSAEVDLPGDLVVYREYDRLCRTARNDLEPIHGEWVLQIDGVTEIPALETRITARQSELVSDPTRPPKETIPNRTAPAGPRLPAVPETSGYQETFDADALGDRLTVRTWRAGDRFRPLGMEVGKKLQDFFVDAKVPRHQRGRTPLVCTVDGRIAWVVGHRIGDAVKVTPATRRFIVLRSEPLRD